MNWIGSPGLQLVAIGLTHNVLGLVVFRRPIRSAVSAGFVGQAAASKDQALAFWFLMFGWVLVLLGGALRALEPAPIPLALTLAMAAMVAVGAAALPKSGFWLALVPLAEILAPRLWG
ncbi:MAG: DUF6463 family protein [Myxococcota bacterium]